MSRYLMENRDSYVFSAITASIDGKVSFEPIGDNGESHRLGTLHVPMDASFIINDGQHRRAAIEQALHEHPEIGDEHISVVFFMDVGLDRCQQMFADLNRYAIRPSPSLGLLYDHRDEAAQVTKKIVLESDVFRDVVEGEKTTLSARSRKLFTLSAVHKATVDLLNGLDEKCSDDLASDAMEFWTEVDRTIPEWALVRKSKITSGEVRQTFLHSHGIALQAIGRLGNSLLRIPKSKRAKAISKLKTVDWSRSNGKLWEGRAMLGGRVSKASQNITLTTNALKIHVGVDLNPEELRVEAAFARGDYERK